MPAYTRHRGRRSLFIAGSLAALLTLSATAGANEFVIPSPETSVVGETRVVAARARDEGFVARFGRKVLELRPPIGAHKGTAVTQLLGERGRPLVRMCHYALDAHGRDNDPGHYRTCSRSRIASRARSRLARAGRVELLAD